MHVSIMKAVKSFKNIININIFRYMFNFIEVKQANRQLQVLDEYLYHKGPDLPNPHPALETSNLL